MSSVRQWFVRLDERIIATLRRIAVPVLRISLGAVFLWFGALKIAGASPVEGLVATTVPWVDPDLLVPGLGVVEAAVGVGLLVGRLVRIVLLVLVLQLVGILFLLVIRPDAMFQSGNPLLLTEEGEFVVKNVVLLAAGFVVGANLWPGHRWKESSEELRKGSRVDDHGAEQRS